MATIDEHVKIMMLKGESGSSIKSIDKTATSGLTDTYTITLTNGDKQQFHVTNGKDGDKGEGVGTLKLGGRNLYTGTRDFSGNWIHKEFWTKEDETYNGFSVRSCSSKWNGIYQSVDAKSGESFVLSGYFKAEAGSDIRAFFAIDQKTTSPNSIEVTRDSDDTTSWTRFALKFEKLVDGEIAPRLENAVYGKKLCVCGLKLERGNNATDWTPAPEDKADATIQQQIVPSASVESSDTASQAYAKGDYVVVNGLLRKATAAIAKGDAIGDTNSTATTVAGELSAVSGELAGKAQFVPIDFTIPSSVDSLDISGVYIGGFAFMSVYYKNKNEWTLPAWEAREVATANNISFIGETHVVAASNTSDENGAHRLFYAVGDKVSLRHSSTFTEVGGVWNMATLAAPAKLK